MNIKYYMVLAALSTAFIACGSDKGSGSDDGDSSMVGTSSAIVPLSSGVTPSSQTPLSSGAVASSAVLPSSGVPYSVFVPSSSSSSIPAIGKLTIDQSVSPMKIMGTMHIEPAFVSTPSMTGKVYFEGAESQHMEINFLHNWGVYIGLGGSATDVVLNGPAGANTLGVTLNPVDFLCRGVYLAVVTLSDGVTTISDTASYAVDNFLGEDCSN